MEAVPLHAAVESQIGRANLDYTGSSIVPPLPTVGIDPSSLIVYDIATDEKTVDGVTSTLSGTYLTGSESVGAYEKITGPSQTSNSSPYLDRVQQYVANALELKVRPSMLPTINAIDQMLIQTVESRTL